MIYPYNNVLHLPPISTKDYGGTSNILFSHFITQTPHITLSPTRSSLAENL